jgi:hypothetical protein
MYLILDEKNQKPTKLPQPASFSLLSHVFSLSKEILLRAVPAILLLHAEAAAAPPLTLRSTAAAPRRLPPAQPPLPHRFLCWRLP